MRKIVDTIPLAIMHLSVASSLIVCNEVLTETVVACHGIYLGEPHRRI
jgi:hypothetical protein